MFILTLRKYVYTSMSSNYWPHTAFLPSPRQWCVHSRCSASNLSPCVWRHKYLHVSSRLDRYECILDQDLQLCKPRLTGKLDLILRSDGKVCSNTWLLARRAGTQPQRFEKMTYLAPRLFLYTWLENMNRTAMKCWPQLSAL